MPTRKWSNASSAMKTEQSKINAAKNVAEDSVRHLEKLNLALREEQKSLVERMVETEGLNKRLKSRAEIAEKGLSTADNMLVNEREKMQALSEAANENKHAMEMLKSRIEAKEVELREEKQSVLEMTDAISRQTSAHEREIKDLQEKYDHRERERTNDIFDLFRFIQAIWHGSLMGQFLSFAAINTPTMGAVANGEVSFSKLDELTREQTRNLVLQIEEQFKRLKQDQRDLKAKGNGDEENKAEQNTVEDETLGGLTMGKLKLRHTQLKQSHISLKMRHAADKELIQEYKKRVDEIAATLEDERLDRLQEKRADEDEKLKLRNAAEDSRVLLQEHVEREERMNLTIKKLTEALTHGGDEESQLALLLKRLKDLEFALKEAQSRNSKQQQELLRQRQQMAELKKHRTDQSYEPKVEENKQAKKRNKGSQKNDDELTRLMEEAK